MVTRVSSESGECGAGGEVSSSKPSSGTLECRRISRGEFRGVMSAISGGSGVGAGVKTVSGGLEEPLGPSLLALAPSSS